jgi:hypothetical protein
VSGEDTMSKMDGLRAMREARYAENAARAKTTAPTAKQPTAKQPTAKKPTAKKPSATATSDRAETAVAETADAGLCGHRNMSGRTCTREHGHAAKSHRYA